MRLEIGAGAAAGRAGGVLWSSAILAAISPLRAAFTSRLPEPARSAAPSLCPPLPATPASTFFFSLAAFAAFWSFCKRVAPSVSLSLHLFG